MTNLSLNCLKYPDVPYCIICVFYTNILEYYENKVQSTLNNSQVIHHMLVEHNRSNNFANTLERFLCQSYIKQGEALVRGSNCPRGVYPGHFLEAFSRGIAGGAFVLPLCPSLVSPDSRGWYSRMRCPVAQAEIETIVCRTRGYVLKLIY